MPAAERLTPRLQHVAEQPLSAGEVALALHQKAEVADTGERVWMPDAERLACHLHRLAYQRRSGDEVSLGQQQPAEVAEGGERVRMPIAERLKYGVVCRTESLAHDHSVISFCFLDVLGPPS